MHGLGAEWAFWFTYCPAPKEIFALCAASQVGSWRRSSDGMHSIFHVIIQVETLVSQTVFIVCPFIIQLDLLAPLFRPQGPTFISMMSCDPWDSSVLRACLCPYLSPQGTCLLWDLAYSLWLAMLLFLHLQTEKGTAVTSHCCGRSVHGKGPHSLKHGKLSVNIAVNLLSLPPL